jgi:hypothetical protein
MKMCHWQEQMIMHFNQTASDNASHINCNGMRVVCLEDASTACMTT